MNSLLILVFLCGAFFFGAIPTGYLLVKHWKHCDVREIGSGNIALRHKDNIRRLVAGAELS